MTQWTWRIWGTVGVPSAAAPGTMPTLSTPATTFAGCGRAIVEGDTGIEDLQALLNQLGPRAKEVAVTTAERLRAEEAARMLLELLAAKFGTLPTETVYQVRSAGTDELETWTLRVLTTIALNEIFAPA